MNECDLLGGCKFFNTEDRNDAVAALLKQQFCMTGGADCARLRVASQVGREHVPATMYPNDSQLAVQIIAEQG